MKPTDVNESGWDRKWDAAPGNVWVCAACGKISPNRGGPPVYNGWDASCFSNAIEVPESRLRIVNGRAVELLK